MLFSRYTMNRSTFLSLHSARQHLDQLSLASPGVAKLSTSFDWGKGRKSRLPGGR